MTNPKTIAVPMDCARGKNQSNQILSIVITKGAKDFEPLIDVTMPIATVATIRPLVFAGRTLDPS